MFDDTPLPHAARLGPTYQGWECDQCGVIAKSEVVELDDGTAWHSGWGVCSAQCRPVELLLRDPRQWANDGIAKMHVLAMEVLRLRQVLADIAESAEPPKAIRRKAKQALFGGTFPMGGEEP